MFKNEYFAYFPQNGERQQWLINPEHLRQACMMLLYQNNQHEVFMQLKRADNSFYTVLICSYEDNKFKFFALESEI